VSLKDSCRLEGSGRPEGRLYLPAIRGDLR